MLRIIQIENLGKKLKSQKMKRHFIAILAVAVAAVAGLGQATFAQYPTISKEDQEASDSIIRQANRVADSA